MTNEMIALLWIAIVTSGVLGVRLYAIERDRIVNDYHRDRQRIRQEWQSRLNDRRKELDEGDW